MSNDNGFIKKTLGKFSWTKLNITLCAVAAIAVAILVFRFCHTAKNTGMQLGVDDKIDVTPTIITSMKEIGEWEFLAVEDEELVDTTKKGFLRDDKLVRIYYGRLSFGINMHKADPKWVKQKGDSIILTLPKIELLDNDFIDETCTRAFIESGSWTDADREQLYQQAYRRMQKRCVTPLNLSIAEQNATEQLGKMLKALGVERYAVEIGKRR